MSIEVLSPLRHRCLNCGGCCHAVQVPLTPEEAERVSALGQPMGISDPVDSERQLRFEAGRCLFQSADQTCRIHGQHGLQAKPLLCQQYPLVITRTEKGLRAGVDPGCYLGWRTWRDGEAISPRSAAVLERELAPNEAAQEERLLDMLDMPDLSLARFAALLCATPPRIDGGLPRGFARRLLERIQRAGLGAKLRREDTGDALYDCLSALLDRITPLDPSRPPSWPVLADEEEAFALEVIRRLVFLRQAESIRNPLGQAGLGLAGAVLCAWADPSPSAFGATLAAWTRAMRSPVFLRALLPRPESLQALILGPQ